MGWNPFKSKKKTQVGTSVSRLVEDHFIGDTSRESILRATLRGTEPVEELTQGILQGPAVRMNRYFNMAKRDYVHGLPNAGLLVRGTASEDLRRAIARETGRVVTQFQYEALSPANNTHMARVYLIREHGYNPTTNELEGMSTTKGAKVYLSGIIGVFSPETLEAAPELLNEDLGLSPTAGYSPDRMPGSIPGLSAGAEARPHAYAVVDDVVGKEGAYIQVVWERREMVPIPVEERFPDGPTERETSSLEYEEFFYSLDEYDPTAVFYQVAYEYEASGITQVALFTYEYNSGKHPELDNITARRSVPVGGEYFPFLFLRRSRKSILNIANNQDEIDSARRLLNLLSLDLDELDEGIHENDDIDKVEQAVLMMGVPIDSDNPVDQAYLFEFFDDLYQRGRGIPGFQGGTNRLFKTKGRENTLLLWDADFEMSLNFSYITRRTIPGKIGKRGTYDSGPGDEDRVGLYRLFSDLSNSSGGMFGRAMDKAAKGVAAKRYHFRKQVTDSAYVEVEVHDPRIIYNVWRNHKVTARIGDEEMLIPISRTVADKLQILQRETLYLRSLHFVFNARETVKVRWYQTGIFKVVLIVAAVVISIYFQLPVYQLALAVTATTAAAIALTVVMVIALNFGVEAAFTFVAKELGYEVAMVLAVMAIMYGGYQAFQAGSVTGAPLATELISAGTNLASTAHSMQVQSKIDTAIKAHQEWELEAEAQWEELADWEKQLMGVTLIDPFEFIGRSPVLIPGEAPDDFYNRTVHSGNIGVLSLDAISVYVESSLRLPDFTDLIGEMSNV